MKLTSLMVINFPSMHAVRTPDDLIITTTPEDWTEPETIAIAKQHIAGIEKLVALGPCGILINLPKTYMSREVVLEYINTIPDVEAIALVSSSFSSKLVGNLVLKIVKIVSDFKTPNKVFNDTEEAKIWLRAHLEGTI